MYVEAFYNLKGRVDCGWLFLLHTAFNLSSPILSLLIVKKATRLINFVFLRIRGPFLACHFLPFFFLFTEEIDIQWPARQRWSFPFPRSEKIRQKPTGVLEPACTISSISFQLHVQWSRIDGLILATAGSISRYENYRSLLPTSPFPQRTGCWTFTSTP